jgi:hypothetical protein
VEDNIELMTIELGLSRRVMWLRYLRERAWFDLLL